MLSLISMFSKANLLGSPDRLKLEIVGHRSKAVVLNNQTVRFKGPACKV